MTEKRCLVIDDDELFAELLAQSLSSAGLESDFVHNGQTALQQLALQHYSHAVLDLKLGQESGLQLLPQILALQPGIKVLMLTAFSSIATAVEAVKLGAHDYLCKPANSQEILQAFSTSAEQSIIPEQPHSIERLEWEHIQRILNENNGNISATARALGMHRRTLQRKLQKKPVEH